MTVTKNIEANAVDIEEQQNGSAEPTGAHAATNDAPPTGEPAGLQGIGIGDKDAAPRRWKVKVDGTEEELSEAELLEHARLGRAAFKRMHEAAEIKKRAMQALERLKDPNKLFEVLTDPGLGLSEEQIRQAFEEWYAEKVIEPSKLTEEQRRIRELEALLAEQERKAQQEAERQEAQRRAQLAQHYEQKFQEEIIKAIEDGGLPADPKTVSRIAYYMTENIRQNLGLPMSAIVERVKKDYQTELRTFVGAFEPEKLVRFIGEDMAKNLAAYYAKELRKRKGLVSATDETQTNTEPSATPRKAPPEDRRFTPAFSKAWIPVAE
jgi:hypothetical protein